MPDLTREEVERRLAFIEEALAKRETFIWERDNEIEALQTALSLYARAEKAEQERDALRARVAELEGENERLRGLVLAVAASNNFIRGNQAWVEVRVSTDVWREARREIGRAALERALAGLGDR